MKSKLNRSVWVWAIVAALMLFSHGQKLNASTESFAVIGDAGEWNSNTQKVRDSIQKSGVRKLILPGDNIYNTFSTYEKEWSPWAGLGFLFSVVAIGNHNDGYENEMRFFGMPAENYSYSVGQSLSLGARAKFIVLNSDNKSTARRQLAWARNELNQATEDLVFVVYHHPSFTVSPEHKWEERKEFQLGMHALFTEYRDRITAIINGHDHIASIAHFNDLPVLVSGATHNVRMPMETDNVQKGVRVKTAWINDRKPYWLRLDINDASSGPVVGAESVAEAAAHATVQFVRATDDRLSCTAHVRTGHAAELEPNCFE